MNSLLSYRKQQMIEIWSAKWQVSSRKTGGIRNKKGNSHIPLGNKHRTARSTHIHMSIFYSFNMHLETLHEKRKSFAKGVAREVIGKMLRPITAPLGFSSASIAKTSSTLSRNTKRYRAPEGAKKLPKESRKLLLFLHTKQSRRAESFYWWID